MHNTDIHTCKEEKLNNLKENGSQLCSMSPPPGMSEGLMVLCSPVKIPSGPGSGESSKMSAVGLTGTSAWQHKRRQSWALWVSLSLWRTLFQPLFDVSTCQHCLGARGVNSCSVTVPEIMWENPVLPAYTQALALQLRSSLWCAHSSTFGMVSQK